LRQRNESIWSDEDEAEYAKFGAFDADTRDRLLVSDLQTLKVLPKKPAFFSNLLEQFSIGWNRGDSLGPIDARG
jgi:hypothetical protein